MDILVKISTSSWHYRAVDLVFDRPNESLCVYFWQVAWCCALCGIALLTACGMVAIPAIGLPLPDPEDLLVGWPEPIRIIAFFAMLFGILGWMAALVLGVNVVFVVIAMGIRALIEEIGAKSRKPGIVAEYVAAKKERICPLIDFEDDES